MKLGSVLAAGGVLQRGRPVPPAQNLISGWGWDDSGGSSASGYGRHVPRAEALQLMAVYGCVRLITDGISTLPLDVFRDVGDGSTVEVSPPTWLMDPTPDLEFEAWCTQVLSSLLLHGNAYVSVLRGSAGAIVALVPLDPLKITVSRRGGRKVFVVDGQEEPGAEILHIKGLMLPGSDEGLSPLEYARLSVGLGLSAQKYGSEFFDGDGNMPGVIEYPHAMQPETIEQDAKRWQRNRKKGGRGLPGIVQAGGTWKPSGVTNEQAQFLATRQYTAAEIAGQVFLVDPSDIGIGVQGTSLTYANLQDRNTRRVQVTFLPWIVRIEKALSSLLVRPRFVKFNVDGLLRGSLKNQFETWAIGIDKQFLVPNEPRGWMDLAPLPGGGDVVGAAAPVRSGDGPEQAA